MEVSRDLVEVCEVGVSTLGGGLSAILMWSWWSCRHQKRLLGSQLIFVEQIFRLKFLKT